MRGHVRSMMGDGISFVKQGLPPYGFCGMDYKLLGVDHDADASAFFERLIPMGLLRFLGVHSTAHIGLVTLLSGARKVGTDSLGNRYYRAGPRKGYTRDRRWVLYVGAAEASTVPPEWHGWLHHQTDAVPHADGATFRQPWQKPPQQNMTGTTQAYRPPGHILAGHKRDKATGDYDAWTPPE